MKLELALLAGAETKAFLANLTKQIDRLEKLSGIATAPVKTAPEVEETEADEEEDDFSPKKAVAKAKKAIAKFEEEDEEDESEEVEADTEEEEEDEDFKTPPPPSKKAKATKKVTVDDVNDACKARAAATGGKEGRNEVLAILKKKFKTTTVSDLKPEQYAQAIEAMTV